MLLTGQNQFQNLLIWTFLILLRKLQMIRYRNNSQRQKLSYKRTLNSNSVNNLRQNAPTIINIKFVDASWNLSKRWKCLKILVLVGFENSRARHARIRIAEKRLVCAIPRNLILNFQMHERITDLFLGAFFEVKAVCIYIYICYIMDWCYS